MTTSLMEHLSHLQEKLLIKMGRFTIKQLATPEELSESMRLRFQSFQVEMVGLDKDDNKLDQDKFDDIAIHLGVFDNSIGKIVATCRLISSKNSNEFYSEQEFDCRAILNRPGIKLEIGRVCVHADYRRGAVLMLLWRGIAEYMLKSGSDILFGCGSVPTLNPTEAATLFWYLIETGKVRSDELISPTQKYQSREFDEAFERLAESPLMDEQLKTAKELLPPLCRMYFDIGCEVAGPPAFDYEFNCIDFLTYLDVKNLAPRLRQKILGGR